MKRRRPPARKKIAQRNALQGPPIAICVGCGCDDEHACLDAFDEPCFWLIVDRQARLGVCSQCPQHLAAWRRGYRTPKVVRNLRS